MTTLVAPSGEAYEVTPEQVAGEIARGAALKTNEQAAMEQAVIAQDAAANAPITPAGALERAKTLGEGGLTGATAGIGNWLVRGWQSDLSSPEAANEYQARRHAREEALPGYSTAGKIGGGLAAAILTGGESLGSLAEGAAAKGLSGLAARGVAGDIAASAASTAIGGALDAGLQGATENLTEGLIGDHELTASALMSAGLENAAGGALFGGALGAAGALGRGAKGLMGRGSGAVMREADAVASGVDDVSLAARTPEQKLADAAAGGEKKGWLSGKIKDGEEWFIRSQAKDPEQAALLRRGLENEHLSNPTLREKHLDELARSSSEELTSAFEASRKIQKIANGEGKLKQMAAKVPEGNLTAQVSQAQDFINDMEQRLAGLKVDGASSGIGAGAIKAFESHLGNVHQVAEAAAQGNASGADLLMSMDRAKRAMADHAAFGKEFRPNISQTEFSEGYERVRRQLEDPAIWGDAARAQKSINASYTDLIPVAGKVHQNFGETRSIGGEFYREADPGKVRNLLGQAGMPGSDIPMRDLGDYGTHLESLISNVKEHYTLTPADSAELAKAQEALAQVRAKFTSAVQDANDIQALKLWRDKDGKSLVEAIPVVGKAASVLTDIGFAPARTLDRMAQIRALAEKAESFKLATRQQKKFSDNLDAAARGLVDGTKPVAALNEAPTGKLDKRFKEAIAETQSIKQRAAEPRTVLPGMPQLSAAMSAQMQRGAQYLQANLPQATKPANALDPNARGTVPEAQMREFMVRYQAVTNPGSVLRDIQHGKVQPAALDALVQVYPKIYEKLRQQLIERVAESTGGGKELPWIVRMKLAVTLGVPTDTSFDPQMMQSLQANVATPPPSGSNQQSAKPPSRPLEINTQQTQADGYGQTSRRSRM